MIKQRSTEHHEPGPGEGLGSWTFLTNHAHVLLALLRNPDLRQRDIAALVGITEGAVQRILNELEAGGYLGIQRVGRRNHYEVKTDVPLRHPLDAGHTVGEVLHRLRPEHPNGHAQPEDNQSAA